MPQNRLHHDAIWACPHFCKRQNLIPNNKAHTFRKYRTLLTTAPLVWPLSIRQSLYGSVFLVDHLLLRHLLVPQFPAFHTRCPSVPRQSRYPPLPRTPYHSDTKRATHEGWSVQIYLKGTQYSLSVITVTSTANPARISGESDNYVRRVATRNKAWQKVCSVQ